MGLPKEIFLRHVNSRWLTLEMSTTRIIDQFPALQEYFKKNTESQCDSQRLNRIKKAFNDKMLLAKLLFLQNVADVFTQFLVIFQAETPMIHILYDEMINFVKTMMGRFLKEECCRNTKEEEVKFIEVDKGDNWGVIDVGCNTEKVMKSLN